jgi:transposase
VIVNRLFYRRAKICFPAFILALRAIIHLPLAVSLWRLLPSDFPPWSTVYRWFAAFRDGSVFERINHALIMADRERVGRDASPSAAIIDRWDGCRPPQTASRCASMMVYEP